MKQEEIDMYLCTKCGHKGFDEVCDYCGGKSVDILDHLPTTGGADK